jgi:hypothetical protein
MIIYFRLIVSSCKMKKRNANPNLLIMQFPTFQTSTGWPQKVSLVNFKNHIMSMPLSSSTRGPPVASC